MRRIVVTSSTVSGGSLAVPVEDARVDDQQVDWMIGVEALDPLRERRPVGHVRGADYHAGLFVATARGHCLQSDTIAPE